ncbi:DNA polymerase III subunit epsilon [Corynebacterium sp. 13CS0277]|uniref:exonuclease domain-containing protein n=1 Tax=Corynebacterium sp. 13CS0277 TaxID=2071994 RepID=UPI000D023177|nr:exonuclease domain-containing protein [Corynebacterium sp. 13CS0277]PRQ11221.1 DNA polymerase III subunit epsilon [Corynebacterium sp. 13CS0277]
MAGIFDRLRGKRHARQAHGPLAEFYTHPHPDAATPLHSAPLLAVDVETTGLHPGRDQLLSIGWVPVNGLTIDLSGAGHVILQGAADAEPAVGHSATIHGLTDTDIAGGVPAADALAQLLTALQGRAMLVHYAAMEHGFLGHACRTHFHADLTVPTVDTFALERRHMERMATYPRGEDLRLPRVRARYRLPHYRSHHALTDALACAELYLALVAHGKATTLGPLLL